MQYAHVFLEQQLRSALCDAGAGAADVWLWLAGRLSRETLAAINTSAVDPGGAADFTKLLFAFSEHNQNGTDLCAASARVGARARQGTSAAPAAAGAWLP